MSVVRPCQGENTLQRWQAEAARRRGMRHSPVRLAALVVWLGFILVPIVTALGDSGPALGHWLVVAAAVAFTVAYIWLVLIWFEERSRLVAYLLCAVMLALSVVLTLADRSSWGFLFTYSAACAGLVVPSPWGFPAVLACSGLAVGVASLGGAGGGTAVGYGTSAVGVGLLLTLMRDLHVRNDELNAARAELARTAVAAERERFARDLHDLLGHTLSVITLKAELAGRLLPSRPDAAATEVGELEQVARQALGEVRQAVSGYRLPTLAGEMEGARMALSAAGIIAQFEGSPVKLAPDVEAVLAWAVREGATNVIRHSGASHCQVRVFAGLVDAEVEVVDDGSGAASAVSANGGRPGNGLAGLSERAEGLRGRLEAGSLPGGGFRLSVTVPASASAAP